MQLQSTIGYLFFIGITLTACSTKDCEPSVNQVLENGTCVCRDGFSGPQCSLEDICITSPANPCEHGVCNDNKCGCEPFWSGEYCNIPSIKIYEGVYKISVAGDNQNRFFIEDVYLGMHNLKSGDPVSQLQGNPKGIDIKLSPDRLPFYESYGRIIFDETPIPQILNIMYWFDTHEKRSISAEELVFFERGKMQFSGHGSIISYGNYPSGHGDVLRIENLTITLERISD